MKFNIPKIVRPLEMSVYAEEMEGLALSVWVNPSRNIKKAFWDCQVELIGLKQELNKLMATKANPATKKIDALNERVDGIHKTIYEWYANIWSQASDPDTHVAVEEIEAMTDEDPALWIFIAQGTQALIEEHAEGTRKN